MANRSIGAGLRLLHYGVVGTAGNTTVLTGNTADGPTAGDTSGQGMKRLEGAQTFPAQSPEPDIVVVSGDDSPLVSFNFDPEDLTSGVIAMATQDLDFEAVIQGLTVQTRAGGAFLPQDPSNVTRPNVAIMVQRVAKSWTPGSRGVKKWQGVMVPRAELKPLGADIEQRTHNPYNYFYNASKTDAYLEGVTFSTGTEGTAQSSIIKWEHDYPFYWHAWRGDNSEDEFDLPFEPANDSNLLVTVNGQLQVLTTHYTYSSGTITFTTPPATDARIVAVFDTEESNL